jgi:hypothetical protein
MVGQVTLNKKATTFEKGMEKKKAIREDCLV